MVDGRGLKSGRIRGTRAAAAAATAAVLANQPTRANHAQDDDDDTVVTTHSAVTVRHSNTTTPCSRISCSPSTMSDPPPKKQQKLPPPPAVNQMEEFVRNGSTFFLRLWQENPGVLETNVLMVYPDYPRGDIVRDFNRAVANLPPPPSPEEVL